MDINRFVSFKSQRYHTVSIWWNWGDAPGDIKPKRFLIRVCFSLERFQEILVIFQRCLNFNTLLFISVCIYGHTRPKVLKDVCKYCKSSNHEIMNLRWLILRFHAICQKHISWYKNLKIHWAHWWLVKTAMHSWQILVPHERCWKWIQKLPMSERERPAQTNNVYQCISWYMEAATWSFGDGKLLGST